MYGLDGGTSGRDNAWSFFFVHQRMALEANIDARRGLDGGQRPWELNVSRRFDAVQLRPRNAIVHRVVVPTIRDNVLDSGVVHAEHLYRR